MMTTVFKSEFMEIRLRLHVLKLPDVRVESLDRSKFEQLCSYISFVLSFVQARVFDSCTWIAYVTLGVADELAPLHVSDDIQHWIIVATRDGESTSYSAGPTTTTQ